MLLIFLVFCVVLFVLFVFVLYLVYPMLPSSLDCPFLIKLLLAIVFFCPKKSNCVAYEIQYEKEVSISIFETL